MGIVLPPPMAASSHRRDDVVLLAYFLVTFGVSWTAWLAAAALSTRPGVDAAALAGLRVPLFYFGVFAPALVALAFVARAEGGEGVRRLLHRIGRWQVGARWYLFAAGFIAAIKLTAAIAHRIGVGAWPRFGETPWIVMALALLVSTWTQAGEEIGWRGFALPRLASRVGVRLASVLLGIVWAAWHLPHFAWPESDLFGQSAVIFFLQVTALSVAMAWLYWRTRGSLLLVMLFHAAVNNTKEIVPSAVSAASPAVFLGGSRVAWLTVGLLWICAAFFLIQMRTASASELSAPET